MNWKDYVAIEEIDRKHDKIDFIVLNISFIIIAILFIGWLILR